MWEGGGLIYRRKDVAVGLGAASYPGLLLASLLTPHHQRLTLVHARHAGHQVAARRAEVMRRHRRQQLRRMRLWQLEGRQVAGQVGLKGAGRCGGAGGRLAREVLVPHRVSLEAHVCGSVCRGIHMKSSTNALEH